MNLDISTTSDRKTIIKNAVMYFFAVGLNRGMPFLLIPLLTNVLSTEEYGIISIAAIITGLLKNTIGLNPSVFLIVNYFRTRKGELAEYITNIFFLVITSSILIFAVYYFLSNQFVFFVGQNTLILAIIFFTAMLMVIEAVVLTLIQMEKQGKLFLLFSLLSAGFQITFVFLLVVAIKGNWQGKLYADFFAELSICTILLLYLRKNYGISSNVSWKKIKILLHFSWPLLPHSICLWGMNFVDRFFLARIVGMESVGIYSAAYNLGLGLMLFYDALQRTWQPFFFERLEKNDLKEKRRIVKLTWLYYLFAITLFIVATGITYLISPLFFGKDFDTSFTFIPLIFLGYTFHGMYRAVAGYLYFLNMNKLLASITISSAILNIFLNYYLITKNGAIGAAQSTALTFLYSFLFVKIVALKRGDMPWFYFIKTSGHQENLQG